MSNAIRAGAAWVEVSPTRSVHLFGYPHTRRMSTGIHDPLLATALYLEAGPVGVIIISVDVILIAKGSANRVRGRIAALTGVLESHIMVTATHTHSGPLTVDYLSNEADSTVPKTDPHYVALIEDGIVSVAVRAYERAVPATLGLVTTTVRGLGTNRRDPQGPSDPEVPVLVVRAKSDQNFLAVMLVCSMHPTVLHEDSTLASGDFPGLARRHLQTMLLGKGCPVLHHTGPCGDQSPRHVVRANTLAEAERLGGILAQEVAAAISSVQQLDSGDITVRQEFLELPLRQLPSLESAVAQAEAARSELEGLREIGAARGRVRTAEVDWFGAEESLTLARAADSGRLKSVAAACLPAEIQVIRIGPWTFVGWTGEFFVEFGLAVKRRAPGSFVISLANGELQGYIVTQQAIEERAYEAGNALFQSPISGEMFVDTTLRLIGQLGS